MIEALIKYDEEVNDDLRKDTKYEDQEYYDILCAEHIMNVKILAKLDVEIPLSKRDKLHIKNLANKWIFDMM